METFHVIVNAGDNPIETVARHPAFADFPFAAIPVRAERAAALYFTQHGETIASRGYAPLTPSAMDDDNGLDNARTILAAYADALSEKVDTFNDRERMEEALSAQEQEQRLRDFMRGHFYDGALMASMLRPHKEKPAEDSNGPITAPAGNRSGKTEAALASLRDLIAQNRLLLTSAWKPEPFYIASSPPAYHFYRSWHSGGLPPRKQCTAELQIGDRVQIHAPDSPGFGTVKHFIGGVVSVDRDDGRTMGYGRSALEKRPPITVTVESTKPDDPDNALPGVPETRVTYKPSLSIAAGVNVRESAVAEMIKREAPAKALSAAKPATADCPDCKGTGVYVGLLYDREPCRTCTA